MWGRSPLCCINRPPQRPCLKHTIFFALLQQQGRSTPAVAAQTTAQMPKHSCHCLHALIACTPVVSGQAHGSTYVAKMRKRLHSDIRSDMHKSNPHNNSECWLMASDDRYKTIHCGHSSPRGCTVNREMMEPSIPKDIWILKHSVTDHPLPMPTFSASREHCALFKARLVVHVWETTGACNESDEVPWQAIINWC